MKAKTILSHAGKKAISVLLAAAMITTAVPANLQATTSTAQENGTFTNPVIWSDVPDQDVIRVGDTYYMSSTTMHLSPGCPIMKSKDLVNWEIVNYVYDILDDSDALALRKGQNAYGKGSWASSLRYNNGTYYVAFASYTTGKTHIYQTKDIENGSWTRSDLDGVYHDLSLLFDDDGKVYMVYGGTTLKVVELTSDATAIKKGGMNKVLIENLGTDAEGHILQGEGAHIQKINGKYYIFIISWPNGNCRTQLCYRADSIDGTYEKKIILQDQGAAQGGIIDTPDGKWYGMVFKDSGSVGRIPVLVPVTWENGWPMMGVNGKVPESMEIPVKGMEEKSLVTSDEFYQGDTHKIYAADAVAETEAVIAESVTTHAVQQAVRADGEEAAGREVIENGDFESGIEPWIGNEGATVAVSTEEAASGESSVKATNRASTGAGPKQEVTGKLVAGGTYKFTAKVKYTEGVDNRTFNACLQLGPSWQFNTIVGSANVKKGEWTTIQGTYTVPADAEAYNAIAANPITGLEDQYLSKTALFFETTWSGSPTKEKDLMDFYVDDVTLVEMAAPGLIGNGGFEYGTDSWDVKDPATLTAVTDQKVSGEYGLLVSDRTVTSSGPKQTLTGTVEEGTTYEFSAKVKYLEGDAAHGFNLCIWYGTNWQNIKVMGSATATKGEWTEIKGKYTVPSDAGLTAADLANTSIFIETAWSANPGENDLMDFYVDDVVLTEQDTSKPGDSPISGENDYNGSNLKLEWQWNHNPENNGWSLTDRSGYLRLKNTTLSEGILDARNTLTQRTYGPECSGSIAVDVSNMKNGDVAGLVALQNKYGYVGVKMENSKKYIVKVSGNGQTSTLDASMTEEAKIECTQNTVYFKIDFDFKNQTDKAYFYYSLDGMNWTKLGEELVMTYDLAHFMGYRFGLFNYATKVTGGYVDFDYFRVEDAMTGDTAPASVLTAELGDVADVTGVQNATVEVPLTMDALPEGSYDEISASFMVPDCMDVENVVFNQANITGKASYTYKNKQLVLTVEGDAVNFTNTADKLFATIQLKVNSYVSAATTVALKTDYIKVNGGNVVYNTTGVESSISLKAMTTNAVAKKIGTGNPIVDNQFAADPYAITYNGRVYVYMTNDSQEYDAVAKDANGLAAVDNSFANINTLSVISSADMVNWTDHGEIQVAAKNNPDGLAAWATCSWAPAAAHKVIDGKDKFFLYFADGGGGIGVLEADSPVGPFREPATGSRLIAPGSPASQGVVWLFDPAVLVDDDGSGYLYYGGGIPGNSTEQNNYPGTGRVIKLKDNMVELDGNAVALDIPGLFEDSGIHKYNDKYYYTYCSNFSNTLEETGRGNICAMVSDNPMGPFEFVGPFLYNPATYFGVGGNNHHAIFEFEDRWYITYHAQTLGKALGVTKGYRSTHINEIEYYSDGTIKDVNADMQGVAQLKSLNPYERVEAETFAWQSGTAVTDCVVDGGMAATENTQLDNIENGDWVALSSVDFGKNGTKAFTASVASSTGATIELRLDNPDGEAVATFTVGKTESDTAFEEMTWDVEGIKGIHNVFMTFKGESGKELLHMDYWNFAEAVGEEAEPSDPTQPTTPSDNSDPTTPSADSNPTTPSGNSDPTTPTVTPTNPTTATGAPTQATTPKASAFTQKNPGLPKGTGEESKSSKYGVLQAKVAKAAKTSQKLTWKKVDGADGYVVFGNMCNANGKKYKFEVLKVINKNTNTSYTHNKLKKGTFYKYLVQAYKVIDGKVKIISTSKTIHSTTKGGKVNNPTAVKVKKTKITLKVKQKQAVKAKVVGKKLKTHRELKYESNNTKVATVTNTGVIRAKKKGNCLIYVYGQNGVCKTVKVKVK